MKWILDANCLIYLNQANLFDNFCDLSGKDLLIDTSVFKETVEDAKQYGYPDADQLDQLLNKYRIPIIPIDIQSELHKFHDKGETSCYILAKSGGTVVTSDIKAIKRFILYESDVIRLDAFFYQNWCDHMITDELMKHIIDQLLKVHAITPERKFFLLNKINQKKEAKS